MRILIMTDSCFLPSGMGRLGKELAIGLAARGHEIGYIGWYHQQDVFPSLPYNIQFWWTHNDFYGSDVLDNIVYMFRPDVLLTIGDFWNLWYISDRNVCKTRNLFQWCSYIPVDGEPYGGGLPPEIHEVVKDIDIPIAYTNYAKNAVLESIKDQETRGRIRTIYHGVDTNLFKPLDPIERKKIRDNFGLSDKFLFLVVSRNQSRKNIPELLRAWSLFQSRPEAKGKVVLWPHMNFSDRMGWNIHQLLGVLKLHNGSLMYYDQVANGNSAMRLLPDSELAKLYQIADAFILLSGEGFGLPTLEAMATKLPCILLNHSASAELGSNGRAHLVPVGFSLTGAHLTQRPLPDIGASIDAMMKVFLDKNYRDGIAAKGYEFARNYTWDKILDDWNMMFLEHEMPFIKPKSLEVVV